MKHLACGAAAAACFICNFALAGVGTLPGASLDAPGSATVGAPAVGEATDKMWTDSNGDGLVQKSEIKPGSQLDKRFSTRDKNGDGVLGTDEYYLPKS